MNPEPCPFCEAFESATYHPDGEGCTRCGAHPCGRKSRPCGNVVESGELLCGECCDELDAADERRHEAAHSAAVLG
jgi:predicted nucleic acid-binding Zn ribbon protein